MNASGAFQELYDTVRRLRGPDGCPWDREQTPETLRGHLLEEVYEIIEAVDAGDSAHVREEIGDVLLLLTMLSSVYEERGDFTAADALSGINEKLIRRHPHVFGDARVGSSAEVVDQWNRIKVEEEGRRENTLLLDQVSHALPSLERAYKLQKKAAKAGFDWPDLAGVIDKLGEETNEVKAEVLAATPDEASLEEEVGDLLFSAVNVSRFLGIDPSLALHRANQKFFRRFAAVETTLKERGKTLESSTLAEMDEIWNTFRSPDESIEE